MEGWGTPACGLRVGVGVFHLLELPPLPGAPASYREDCRLDLLRLRRERPSAFPMGVLYGGSRWLPRAVRRLFLVARLPLGSQLIHCGLDLGDRPDGKHPSLQEQPSRRSVTEHCDGS